MLTINLRNIEKIIFRNPFLKKLLPEFKELFKQWSLAQSNPHLRNMGKQAVIDLLAAINDNHIKIIAGFLQMPVEVDKLSNRVIKRFDTTIDELEDKLNELQEFGYYFIYREGDQIYISSWR